MYLKELKIKNWQCIEDIEIKFENLMLFIGPVSYTHLTLPTNREV